LAAEDCRYVQGEPTASEGLLDRAADKVAALLTELPTYQASDRQIRVRNVRGGDSA